MMIKNILKVIKNISFFGLILLVFACVDDDDNGNVIEGTNSIINYMDKNPRFSLFEEVINKAGLAGVLDGNAGTLTLLAPNNTAVEAYLATTTFNSVDDIPEDFALNLVNYHLLETVNASESFVTGYLKTLSNVPLTDSTETSLNILVNNENLVKFNGYIGFVEADIEVDNGILHEIDGVLALPTLKTFLEADSNLTPFYQEGISSNSEFASVVNSTENHTVIVPSADAFTAYWDNANLSAEETTRFFNYTLQDSLNLTEDYLSGYIQTLAKVNFNNQEEFLSLYLNKQVGLLFNGTSTITVQDIVTTNGVLHVVDEVLTIPTLADFVLADFEIQTLEDAFLRDDLATEDYLGTLSNSENTNVPITIFVRIVP
jgi:uncharacterized surface protein with fasciclin (FAS1) repeats